MYTAMLKYKKKEITLRIDVFEISQGNSLFFVNIKFVDGNYETYVEIIKEINSKYFDNIRLKDKL